MARFAQEDITLLAYHLHRFQMLLRLAPFTLNVPKQMPVLHAAAAVKTIVHMLRVVFHEIPTLWADRVQHVVKLKHISDQ